MGFSSSLLGHTLDNIYSTYIMTDDSFRISTVAAVVGGVGGGVVVGGLVVAVAVVAVTVVLVVPVMIRRYFIQYHQLMENP